MTKSILLVAGEASGDLHGAAVVREILKQQPAVHVYGVGGEELGKAGMELLANSSDIAVTGFFEVFVKLRKILQIFRTLVLSVYERQPSLVILIDCPDFNLRLAKRLHKTGIPIIYYISPQVWIWRRERVHLIKKYISRMLVVFPFEKIFYRSLGVEVDFVGHPLLDCAKPPSDKVTILKKVGLESSKKTIVLMPGSRRNEISLMLRPILEAAQLIYEKDPQVQFLLPMASTLKPEDLRKDLLRVHLPLKVVKGQVYEALTVADVVICCSGTATLETAIFAKPMVVVFKLNLLTYYLVAPLFVKGVQFFALPNLLAARQIVPELIQSKVTPGRIAEEVRRYFTDSSYRQETVALLEDVKGRLGEGGAAQRVAQKIIYLLEHSSWNCLKSIEKKNVGLKIAEAFAWPFLWCGAELYRLGMGLKRYLYWTNVFKTEKVLAKVISVGNLTAGGTGKTPLTILLAQTLQRQGKKVAVVSRGYKRKKKNPWECVSDGEVIKCNVLQSGDEPTLMARKLNRIPIYVGANRPRVANEILKRHDVDTILLDDGYQHWRIHRDFDFVTFDISNFQFQDQLLPLGRFRERLPYIKRANCIVLTRTDHVDPHYKDKVRKYLAILHPNAPMIEANYRSRYLLHIQTAEQVSIEALEGKRVFGFAGIGNPRSFQKVISDLKSQWVGFVSYPDHFNYSKRHVDRLFAEARQRKADLLLTTEKDFVRLRTDLFQGKLPAYALGVELEITEGLLQFEEIAKNL